MQQLLLIGITNLIRKAVVNMPIQPVSGEIKAQPLNENFSYLDSQVSNINAGPFETYVSLSALNSAWPNGRAGYAVVLESDGKTGYIYTWAGSIWTKGALFQAAGIADGTVTRPKMTIFEKAFEDAASSAVSWEEGYYYNRSNGEKVINASYGNMTLQLEAGHSYNIFGTRNGEARHVTYWNSSGVYVGGASTTVISVSTDTEVRIGLRIDEKANVSVVESSQSYVFNDPQSFSTTANIANLGATSSVDWYVSDKTASKKDVLIMTESGYAINSDLTSGSANVALTVNGKRFSIKFSDMLIDSSLLEWSATNVHRWLFFNPYKKTFYAGVFSETQGRNINLQHSIFLGVIYYSDDASIRRQSTNRIPVNYRGYSYPSMDVSSLATRLQLPLARISCFSNADVKPIIDYVSRKIMLLKGESYIVDFDGSYVWWGGSSAKLTEDYVFDIPSDVNTGYLFLKNNVGNPLLFLKNAAELSSTWSNDEYYIGYITMNAQTNNIQFPTKTIRSKGTSTAFTISFLGDSMSTFSGWIPVGTGHYPSAWLADVDQTYWKMILNLYSDKLSLCLNQSRSGSQVTDVGESTGEHSAQYRCEHLDNDGQVPNIVYIYLGANDFNRNIPLGDYDGTSQEFPTDTTIFSEAYAIMLKKITAKYPNARIICSTLPFNGRGGFPRVREDGLTIQQFNDRIRKIASLFGAEIVEFERAGFTPENISTTTEDNLHPTPAGMNLLFKQAAHVVGKTLVVAGEGE